MKYHGIVFDLYHEDGTPYWEEPAPEIKATLTLKRASIDYTEDGGTPIHVEANSSDGIVYTGTWGSPRLHSTQPVSLQRFESKKNEEVILIGTWHDKKDHREGVFVFRLTPD